MAGRSSRDGNIRQQLFLTPSSICSKYTLKPMGNNFTSCPHTLSVIERLRDGQGRKSGEAERGELQT